MYNICFFYDNDSIKIFSKQFYSSEDALRWAFIRRLGMSKLFGAIIYKTKHYLDTFLSNQAWRIFKLAAKEDYCIISIQDRPPLISFLEDFKKSDMELVFEDMLGFQMPSQKLILAYTGALKTRGIFTVLAHELGHLAFDYATSLEYESYALRHELEAWEWALKNCKKIGIRPDYIRRIAKDCLQTYMRDSKTKYKKLHGCGMPRKNWIKKYKELTRQHSELKID